MSKRKAEEPPVVGGKGKQKMSESQEMSQDELLSMALGEDSETVGALPNADELCGEEEPDADDVLHAAVFGDEFGLEEPSESIFRTEEEEIGELPDGIDESQLEDAEEVDLSKVELTVPEARRVAQSLARNSSLTKIKFADHSLAISDLEEDELEWDSEEYTDIDAIIIAELLKANETVTRLDLARNQIGDAGARALAALFTTNTTIEYLNLESNTFGERGGIALCHAMGENSSLTYLNLKENAVPTAIKDAIRDRWQASRGESVLGLHL